MQTKAHIWWGQYKKHIIYFIVVLLVIMAVIGALVGTSFSLFSYNAPGRKENTIVTGSSEPPLVGGAKMLVEKSNPETLNYNSATSAQKLEMWTHSHPATESTEALTDYRYIGKNPNNYIRFNNNQIWRIIGVFVVDNGKGKLEHRIKIINTSNIGSYSFDNKANGTGSSTDDYGSSEWSDSALQIVLNSGPYFNHTSGNCPSGQKGATTACNFSSTGLSDDAKKYIEDAVFYLGGSNTYKTAAEGLAPHWYSYERGTTRFNETRSLAWTGKVGLMYISDYGYATVGGSKTNREACLAKELYNWNDANYSDCKDNDWLYNASAYQWALVPRTSGTRLIFRVSSSGAVGASYAYESLAVLPVVYLKYDVDLTGAGTSSSPYTIVGDTQTPTPTTNNPPSITVSKTGGKNTATINATISDDSGVVGYTITSSTATPTSWTTIASTLSTTASFTKTSAGTYYVHAKDNSGKTSYSQVTLSLSSSSSCGCSEYDSNYQCNDVCTNWESYCPDPLPSSGSVTVCPGGFSERCTNWEEQCGDYGTGECLSYNKCWLS